MVGVLEPAAVEVTCPTRRAPCRVRSDDRACGRSQRLRLPAVQQRPRVVERVGIRCCCHTRRERRPAPPRCLRACPAQPILVGDSYIRPQCLFAVRAGRSPSTGGCTSSRRRSGVAAACRPRPPGSAFSARSTGCTCVAREDSRRGLAGPTAARAAILASASGSWYESLRISRKLTVCPLRLLNDWHPADATATAARRVAQHVVGSLPSVRSRTRGVGDAGRGRSSPSARARADLAAPGGWWPRASARVPPTLTRTAQLVAHAGPARGANDSTRCRVVRELQTRVAGWDRHSGRGYEPRAIPAQEPDKLKADTRTAASDES